MASASSSSVSCSADSKPLHLLSQLEEAEEGAPGEGVVDRVVHAKVTLRTDCPTTPFLGEVTSGCLVPLAWALPA